jgi:tetratricopeptide (TPR) repeat protein
MLLLVALTLALTAQQSAPPPPKPSKPLGTFDDPGAGPTRPFKSVGVRGTIDAGGYAASAEVKSQSEFYEQLADLQIAALRSTWAPQDHCDRANSMRAPSINLLTRGEFSKAATMFETLLRTDDQPATHQLLGLAYEGSGQLEAAAEQFRIAAAARPDAAAMVAHGAALLFSGEVDQAGAVFHRASESALGRLGLGAAQFQHGRITEALSLFLDVASADPDDGSAYGFIAVALRSADPAIRTHCMDVLNSLTRRSPQTGGAHYALACGLIAAAGGAPDGAQYAEIERELKDAVRLEPQLADAHFRLAGVYATADGDLPDAITEYRFALDCNPRIVEAHYRLSQLYTRSGQPELAKEQLELHTRLRDQQKSEIESGKIPLRFPKINSQSCPGDVR